MNPPPLISVLISNYNRGNLLPETLDSLLRQDFTQWEAIVVDDGSTDHSAQVGARYMAMDARIRFVQRSRNPRGAPTCRNIGMELARGSYLIFLDSDDLLSPGALSQRMRTIETHPDLDFWVFPILMFSDDPANARTLWNIDTRESDLHRFLILDAPWQTTGPIWKIEAVARIGGFTEGLACWQDVDFHLKALIAGLKGRKFYDDSPDVYYRQHVTQSISQGEISSPAKLQSRFDIFRSHTIAIRQNPPPDHTPDGLKADLRHLGGHIALGAARALNRSICLQVIRFGRSQGLFSTSTSIQLLSFLVFYLLRLNKFGPLNAFIQTRTAPYRQDAHIGKHPFIPTPP